MNNALEKENLLVEEAKSNPEKFAAIYDKYVDQIYRYVYRRVNDQAVAEDLVSQSFYDGLCHLKSYQFRGYPFSAWLYKIAHNNVLKWYRVNSRYQTVDLDEVAELKDGTSDLRDDIDLKEEGLGVKSAMDKLDYKERELVRLKYFEEVSNIEIGQIMGITANNVGVKLYRVLKKLKLLI
jgi:RNA polymerase sigma-70 factor (ECF subfamily)